ncbi:MAG: tetratricopeptide repeat protein, partial [candidate division WOR-3 bacterium]
MKKLIFLGIVFLFIACPPTAKNAARIYIQQGEYEAAKEQILIGLQGAPNDYEYYVLLSKVEIGMADWLAATDAFYRGIAVDSGKTVNWLLNDKQNIPVYWQAFYNAAVSLMNAKQYDRTLKNLRYCELFDPKNVSQYILEGGIYSELGEKEKAGAAYTRALSIDPENPEAYFMVGRAKFDKGAYDSALVDLGEAEKFFLKKYDRTARIVFQNLPAVDKSISKEIIQLWGEKNEEALDVLVKVKLGLDGGLEPHRRTLEQFFKTTDGLSRTYYYTGMVHYNLRNDSLALSNFLKSLDLKADDVDALYYAGEIYLKHKKYDESMKLFRRITEFRADDAYAWFYVGVNHTQKKEYQK